MGWDSSQLAGGVGGRAERSLRMLRRPWWVWGCAGAALIIAMFGWFSAVFPRDPLPTVGAWLTLAVVLAAGVIAAGSPNQRANGRLMLLIGLALSTNYLFFNSHGVFVFVAYVLAPFADLLLYVLLLRWPRSRLQTRSQVWLVRVALVGIPLLVLVDEVCYDPAWDGYPDLWWPSVVPNRDFCYATTQVRYGYILALLVVFLIVLPARVRWASRPERRELVPVVIAALALSAAEAYVSVRVLAQPTAAFDVSLLFYLAYAAVPLSFLVAMLVRRLQRASAVEALLNPERLPTPESVRQALARALGDDRLRLALYSPDQGGYVDVDGAPASEVPPDRFAVQVPTAGGTPIARLDLHPRLEGRPELTTSVLQAAAVALENARLQADLQAQLRKVEMSEMRLDETKLEHAIRSGHRARVLLAYEEAAAHFRQALELLDASPAAPPARRCELLLALAETQLAAADMPAARASYQQAADAARHADAADLLAKAALGLGGAELSVGVADQLQIQALEEALDALDAGDSALRAQVLARLARALPATPESGRRTQLSQQAVAMARRVGDPAVVAAVLSDWHLAIWGVEDPERRLVVADEIVRLGQDSGQQMLVLQGHTLRSGDLLELGDLAAMGGEVDAVERAANQLRQLRYQWQVPLTRATLAHLAGRLDQAEQLADEALASGRRAGEQAALLGYLGLLVTVRSTSGRRVDELIGPLRETADHYSAIPTFRAALAMLLAGVDRREEGRQQFERVATDGLAKLPRDHRLVFCLACLAATCAQLEDRKRAAQLYELLLPSAGHVACMARMGAGCLGAVAHQLGMLAATMGRWEDAVAHLEAAIATHARMNTPPFLAISHYHLARALEARRQPGDSQQASQHHAEAVTLLRRLDLRPLFIPELLPAQSASPEIQLPPDKPADTEVAVLRREGEYWTVAWQARTFRLRDMSGLGYLARLLEAPGHELHALELAAPAALGERGPLAPAATASLGPILDPQAKAAYRRRLEELSEEREQAETWGDTERAARARAEIDALTEQLAAAVGLGGRDRTAASQAERARVNVTKAIRTAIRRIAEHDPGLGDHLRRSVRTGTFCAYAPDPTHPVAWKL